MLSRVTTDCIEAYPADAARVLELATPEVAGEVLSVLPAAVAAQVLRTMNPHAGARGLAQVAVEKAAALVKHLPVERAAALLACFEPAERGALVKALPATVSVPLRMVLRFPAGSVGSLIDPHVVTVREETSVGEAAESARRAPSLLRKYLYVLDREQRLAGVVDARQCLLRDPDTPIGRLVRRGPVALRARSSLREAGAHPGWERFSVMPVTDHRGAFLGVLRRTSLRRATAEPVAVEPKAELGDLAIDLADLYWQATAGVLVGAGTERGGA